MKNTVCIITGSEIDTSNFHYANSNVPDNLEEIVERSMESVLSFFKECSPHDKYSINYQGLRRGDVNSYYTCPSCGGKHPSIEILLSLGVSEYFVVNSKLLHVVSKIVLEYIKSVIPTSYLDDPPPGGFTVPSASQEELFSMYCAIVHEIEEQIPQGTFEIPPELQHMIEASFIICLNKKKSKLPIG